MKCDTRKCPSPPSCRASWGPPTEPRKYSSVLCSRCLDSLWEQMERSVSKGDIEWQLSSLSESEKGIGM